MRLGKLERCGVLDGKEKTALKVISFKGAVQLGRKWGCLHSWRGIFEESTFLVANRHNPHLHNTTTTCRNRNPDYVS